MYHILLFFQNILTPCHITIGSECNGVSSCCIPGIPCDEGEGDCDSTLDCKEGLVCGHNNCPKKDGGDWDIADDCCFKPEKGNDQLRNFELGNLKLNVLLNKKLESIIMI